MKSLRGMKWTACYVRVSTWDQEKGRASQRWVLKEYVQNHGMEPVRFYTDTISGASTSRPKFDKLQKHIFQGKVHTVVVWKLDRISRKGVKEGLTILGDWLKQGIRVVSVTQNLDFNGAQGEFLASVFFALARMEREALIENTKRGLAAAKAKGIKLGKRPKVLIKDILPLLKDGKSVNEVAEHLGVHRQTIYALLWRKNIKLDDVTRTSKTSKRKK